MCSEILTAAARAWSRSAIIFSSSSRPTDIRMSVSLMPSSFFSFSGTETWVILTLEKKGCTMGNGGGWNVTSKKGFLIDFYLIFPFSPINHYDMTRYCIKLVNRNNRISELLVNHKYHKPVTMTFQKIRRSTMRQFRQEKCCFCNSFYYNIKALTPPCGNPKFFWAHTHPNAFHKDSEHTLFFSIYYRIK